MVHRYNQIAILRVTLINIMEYLILSGINIPVEGFPMLWIFVAVTVVTPIVMYFLKMIRKPAF